MCVHFCVKIKYAGEWKRGRFKDLLPPHMQFWFNHLRINVKSCILANVICQFEYFIQFSFSSRIRSRLFGDYSTPCYYLVFASVVILLPHVWWNEFDKRNDAITVTPINEQM